MGTGYTRNDTANNIADGNVINASDLDGEFDAIQAAFNASTGHSHDGTTGEGPQIGTGGIADNAVTLGTKTTGNYVATAGVSGVGLSGSASAEGATFTVTSNATDANTASTIVARDASGNFSAGNVTVGNLITAGNVDGRDVSADGSKLDGIEAGATADQTKADIDALGINAATLDSLDSTQFLRSDAADTKTSGDLSFADSVKAQFGASNDLQIYHDGSNSYIHDYGTGSLYIDATQLNFRNGAQTATYADFTNGGGARLMHNGNVKFETVGGGVQVTGYVQADSLYLGDNERAYFGASNDLQIYHDGSQSYITDTGAGSLRVRAEDFILQNADGSNTFLYADAPNGAVLLYYNGSQKFQTTSSGIDVTGNITVSGTVDGRDVASDGSKLDGIESGATADQSASEILTLIKTVDGAGSGLDADSLDGLSGGSYLRSDAADTKTSGNLIFNDNIQLQFGNSADLEIYHNGTNSIIADVGTGDLIVYTNGAAFQVDSNTGENMIYAAKDAGVNLYHNNTLKLQTTSNGANLDGDLNAVNNIYLASAIYHEGDTDTYTQFHNANQWRVVTGGTEMLEVNDSYVLLGSNTVGKVQVSNVASSITPDLYTYNSFVLTLTGNITLNNPSTEVAGMSGVFVFIHSGAARTVSLGTDYETAGGAGLTLSGTAGATDVVPYTVSASGRILLGTPQLAFS